MAHSDPLSTMMVQYVQSTRASGKQCTVEPGFEIFFVLLSHASPIWSLREFSSVYVVPYSTCSSFRHGVKFPYVPLVGPHRDLIFFALLLHSVVVVVAFACSERVATLALLPYS